MNKKLLIPAIAAMLASLGMMGNALAATNSVELHFSGAERVTTNATGGLDIVKADGSLMHYHPKVYQTINGKRHDMIPGYHIVDKDRVELLLQDADPAAPIVVR
jgi:hypothetical protein